MGFADELKNKASELIEDVKEKFDGDPKEPEVVEDFAAEGPAPEAEESDSPDERDEYVEEEAEEFERHSQPGPL